MVGFSRIKKILMGLKPFLGYYLNPSAEADGNRLNGFYQLQLMQRYLKLDNFIVVFQVNCL